MTDENWLDHHLVEFWWKVRAQSVSSANQFTPKAIRDRKALIDEMRRKILKRFTKEKP